MGNFIHIINFKTSFGHFEFFRKSIFPIIEKQDFSEHIFPKIETFHDDKPRRARPWKARFTQV